MENQHSQNGKHQLNVSKSSFQTTTIMDESQFIVNEDGDTKIPIFVSNISQHEGENQKKARKKIKIEYDEQSQNSSSKQKSFDSKFYLESNERNQTTEDIQNISQINILEGKQSGGSDEKSFLQLQAQKIGIQPLIRYIVYSILFLVVVIDQTQIQNCYETNETLAQWLDRSSLQKYTDIKTHDQFLY